MPADTNETMETRATIKVGDLVEHRSGVTGTVREIQGAYAIITEGQCQHRYQIRLLSKLGQPAEQKGART